MALPKEAEKYLPYFDKGWLMKLYPFLLSEDYSKIKKQLKEELEQGIKITPSVNNMFNAFKACPYDKLSVVIIGQDPYPAEGIAHGIAFSSQIPKLPKSLQVIYRGIEESVYRGLELNMVRNPDLTYLAQQGVLLLNTALTTRVGHTESHLELWKPFIKYLITEVLDNYNPGLVVNFWGAKARKLDDLFAPFTHWYLYADHPASAVYKPGGAWSHNNCFAETNKLLVKSNGREAQIKWDEFELIKEDDN